MTFNQAEVINVSSFSATNAIAYIVPSGMYAMVSINGIEITGSDGTEPVVGVRAAGASVVDVKTGGGYYDNNNVSLQRTHTIILNEGESIVASGSDGGINVDVRGVAVEFNKP